MKQGKSRLGVWLCAAFMAVLMLTAAMGLVACGGAGDLKIDVPDRIEEDLGTGTYVVPHYDVVNKNGMIMAGYSVRLKSVADPDGNPVEPVQEASTVVPLAGAGEYTFVYTADSKNVADAKVVMDFADRTAPTIRLSSSQFPSFFIKGNTYAVPEYTLQGDFSAAKCYTKVFYNDGNGGEDTEVTMQDGNFTVEQETGKYTVLIHVEDAVGNANEYRYVRSVYAPAHYDPSIVVYFNEAFGERQVTPEDNYTGKYVSVADGGKAYGNETGSYKVEFNGNPTSNNEAYFAINVPAITNIIGYKELEMYVYVEDDACANGATQWVVGSKWWNDTAAKVGEWTRVTWSIDNWGNGTGANSGANTSQVISIDNISGTRIRLIPDGAYSNTPAPHGTVYFSAMRLIPWDWVNITAENGVQAPKRVKAGENVTLSAPDAAEGKYFDCFLVNGRPISGNTFVAREENTTVSVRYSDAPISAENFTWGETDFYAPAGGDAQTTFIANAQHWAIEYDLYGMENNADGSATWCYTGVYAGGSNQLLGFELDGRNDKLSGYGGSWKEMSGVKLSAAQSAALRGATQSAPVKVAYVRSGDKIVVLLNGEFAGVFSFAAFEVSGDDFGLGGRNGPTNAVMKNIRYTVGETLTEYAQIALGMEVTVQAENGAHADKEKYRMGDTVTLTADPAETGKKFAYYEVNDQKISGDSFVITRSVTVKAVYSDISLLTLGEGVALKDGSTGTVEAAKGADIELVFTGKSPSGKYFKGFKADTTLLDGNVFVPTENAHTVTAEFADRVGNDSEEVNDVSRVIGVTDWRSKGDNAPAQAEYVTDRAYDGIDKSVSESGSLKVTLNGSEQGLALNKTKDVFISDYRELYFYAYTEASGMQAGAWWCADTPLTPGKWTKITVTRSMNLLGLSDAKVWETGVEEFVYRFMGGKEGTVVYVTSLFGVPYADVDVTIAAGSKDTLTLSAPANGKTYKENETITLTAAPAPVGQAFAYFTVNGEKYEDETYTLSAQAVEFGVVYGEISTLTLAEGITANGESGSVTVARGASVTLAFTGTAPAGQMFDCLVADETEKFLYTFVADKATHSITARFVSSLAEATWMDGANAKELTYTWSDGAYTSTVKTAGGDTHWVEKVTATFATGLQDAQDQSKNEWYSIDFFVGKNATMQLRLHANGSVVLQAMGGALGDGTVLTVTEAQKTALLAACNTESAQVELTCIRNGNTFLLLYNGKLLAKVRDFDFKTASDDFGVGGTDCAGWLTRHPALQWQYITGQDKTEAYIAAHATATVTADANTTLDRADGKYTFGDTVTLTEAPAAEGKKFLHFAIGGTPIKGNTFVVTENAYSVTAEYADISTLTLAEGITVNGESGSVTVARGETVTLAFTGTAPAGQIFDCFVVDNTTELGVGEFTATAAKHDVKAKFASSIDAVTWMRDAAAEAYTYTWSYTATGKAAAAATHWITNATVKFPNAVNGWYIFDFAVGFAANGKYAALQVRMHPDVGVKVFPMTSEWPELITITGEKATAIINQCAQKESVVFTCVRSGNTYYLLFEGELLGKVTYDFGAIDNRFGVGGCQIDWVGESGNNWTKNPENFSFAWVAGQEKTDLYVQAAIQPAHATLSPANGFKLGDTVTVTAAEPQAGFKLEGIYVNGEKIEGNSFTVRKRSNTVEARYEDQRDIVIAEHAASQKTTDGKYTLAAATIVDAEGEPIPSLTAAIKSITDNAGNSYTAQDGAITIAYRGAIELTVTYQSTELQKEKSYTVRLQPDDGMILQATETGAKTIAANGSVITFDESKKHGDDNGSIKLTVNTVQGNQDYGYLTPFDWGDNNFVEFWVYTDTANMKTGCWWYGDTVLTQNEWTPVRLNKLNNNGQMSNFSAGRWIIRLFNGEMANANFWFSSMRLGKYAENQINNVVLASGKDGTYEPASDKVYDGDDANIIDKSVLKVTYAADKNDASFGAGPMLISDISGYDEVYFYVYVTDSGMQSGTWWCCDTPLTPGAWTKVTVKKGTENLSGLEGNNPFDEGKAWAFAYRMQQGGGKTAYFTALYGVKA